jgi:hypothetical protein
MGPKSLAAELPAAPPHDGDDQSSRPSTHDSTTPPYALSLVLELMAMINARLGAHATETCAPRRRDALRDAHLVQTQHSVQGDQPPFLVGSLASNAFRGGHGGRGGRRPTINPVIIGCVVNETTGFDKESLNRSMKMTVPTMGPNTDFMSWKRTTYSRGQRFGCTLWRLTVL